MGFLSEFKKLFFVKKAVTKSAMDKTAAVLREKTEDFSSGAEEVAQKSVHEFRERTAGLRDAVKDKSRTIQDKGRDMYEDISEKIGDNENVRRAGDFTERVGGKVLHEGEKVVNKAKDISEKVGEKLFESGQELTEKAKDLSENVGKKTIELGSELKDRAQKSMDRLGEELDKTMNKAEKWAEEEKLKPKKDFADDTLDPSKTLLSDKDDFFSKASRYADGDYGVMSEGKTSIKEDKDESIQRREPARAAGFEDHDGDGNELIDDAIIIGEDE